jgi:hypothetical protein
MTETVRSALTQFRRSRGLCEDEENRRVWLATLGNLIVPLPNFRWRQEILARHDAHHLITGYETTVGGELSLAAWELGVGCYSSLWARILCAGLMITGLVVQSRATINAYRCGQQSADFYAQGEMTNFFDVPLAYACQKFAVSADRY